ncbi:MAG TPA: Mth938-like domain-containing protein [Stellaceae bacterium]|nr:Mth938-like domain-containing protein [Stellaceae bacterium]
MDLTPIIQRGRQVIESYGPGGFRVSGQAYASSILIFPDQTLRWDVGDPSAIKEADLAPVLSHGGVEILLLGCGARLLPVPPALRQALKAAGIVVDPMDTGAACRTYNVLMAEERPVAAALIRPE